MILINFSVKKTADFGLFLSRFEAILSQKCPFLA